jgi:YhcH/YjgK/YiaL family protein
MIFDNISKFKKYSFLFPEIYEYIQKANYNKLSIGKHIISKDAFVLVDEYQSSKSDKNIFENHHKYIDIQLVTSGIEKINYTDTGSLTLTKTYNREDDYGLYEGE